MLAVGFRLVSRLAVTPLQLSHVGFGQTSVYSLLVGTGLADTDTRTPARTHTHTRARARAHARTHARTHAHAR